MRKEITWDQAEKQSEKKSTLIFRKAIAVFFVMLFCLSLNSVLNYFNFQKNLMDTVESTFESVLQDIIFKIESGMSLGLELASLSNIQPLLESGKRLNNNIHFIMIVSPGGEQLFSTQHNEIDASEKAGLCSPENFESDWDVHFHLEDHGAFAVLSYPLLNSIEQLEGFVCLGYDQALVIETTQSIRQRLYQDTAIVLFVFLLTSITIIYLLLRHSRQDLANIDRQITAIVNQLESDTPTQHDRNKDNKTIEQLEASLHEAYHYLKHR